MVYLARGKSRVEGYVDVGRPWRELEVCHVLHCSAIFERRQLRPLVERPLGLLEFMTVLEVTAESCTCT